HTAQLSWTVRIDQVLACQLACRARELTEHQSARLVMLARHVLLAHQVHAVAQWRDNHDVGGPVKRGKFRPSDRLMQIVHDRVTDTSEFAIDPADQSLDVTA